MTKVVKDNKISEVKGTSTKVTRIFLFENALSKLCNLNILTGIFDLEDKIDSRLIGVILSLKYTALVLCTLFEALYLFFEEALKQFINIDIGLIINKRLY